MSISPASKLGKYVGGVALCRVGAPHADAANVSCPCSTHCPCRLSPIFEHAGTGSSKHRGGSIRVKQRKKCPTDVSSLAAAMCVGSDDPLPVNLSRSFLVLGGTSGNGCHAWEKAQRRAVCLEGSGGRSESVPRLVDSGYYSSTRSDGNDLIELAAQIRLDEDQPPHTDMRTRSGALAIEAHCPE